MKQLIYFIVLALLGSVAFSQSANTQELIKPEYAYRHYTTQDGLPSNMNEAIIQDGRGFIWIAGTKGLTRFDGFTFTNYMEGRYANLYRLDKDENGNVRAFSRNLIYSFDKNNRLTKSVLSPDLILSQYYSLSLPDGYGIYSNYIEKQQALYKIQDGEIKEVLKNDDLDTFSEDMHTFFDVEKQELYLFYEDGVMKIIAHNKETVSYPDIFAGAACRFHNTLYLLTTSGIYRFADRKMQLLIEAELSFAVFPVRFIADSQGTLYFNIGNTLYRFDGEKIEAIFQANMIMDFIIDNENNLWITTFQGLYNLFKMDFINYRLQDKTDVVRTVVYHPEREAVIAGTLNGKIIEINKNGIKEIRYPEALYGDFFNDYIAIKDDALYLPGPGDILLLSAREKRWLNLPVFNTPLFVIPLLNGNLLEGGHGYLFEFSTKGKLIKDFGEYAMQQAVVAKPCFDTKKRLWIGGSKGITIYDYNAHSIVKTLFSDSLKLARYMTNDAEGNVWFSSENRLFVSSGDSVKLEKTFPQIITCIYFTNHSNRLIVYVLNGFYLFDEARQRYVFYNHENGFPGGESASGAVAEDADGNIWLPSLNGLFRFHPEKLTASCYKPNLQLVSVLFSTNNIDWQQFEETNPTLNYRQKNIRFHFIGLSYNAAQNVNYYYRLKGFQDEWSAPSKQREVTFNNLPAGDYLFEIYADAGTEESRSEVISFAFSIKPAFWQTVWFLIAGITFLILIVTGTALQIQRRKNKTLLEKLRTEKELNELRISSIRLKAIPHFNANVLAAIEYYITNRTKEDAMRILGIYSEFTLKTLSEVDKAARPLSEELAYVKMYLDLEKIRFLDKFDFQINVEEKVNKEVQLPNMILHTYCENAVKHGLMPLKSGGILTINVSQRNHTVCVSVEDNGVGRTYAIRNPQPHSTKQGLSILNRQIEIYNRFNREKINQQIDDLETGTRFTVEIPIKYTYC